MQLFSPDLPGTFVSRPNRFIVIVDTALGRVRAHCPNPGRMQELLLPGTPLILEKPSSGERKTAYSLVAAKHKGIIVPLHSSRTNTIARELILPRLFPSPARVRAEASYGSSRFDFAVETPDGTILVEVKSCTLCEEELAMFPDAPTERGVKHLREMAVLVESGSYKGEKIRAGKVIFVIGFPSPKLFAPNLHTDPTFAKTLKAVSGTLDLHSCSVEVDVEGTARLTNLAVPMLLEPAELVGRNCGVYLLLLQIEVEIIVRTGSLGALTYRPGWYVYAGSAKRNLTSRIARHLRKKKKLRWHIDYLSIEASKILAFPIYTDQDLECDLSVRVKKAGGGQIHKFGSSDCACDSHLFWFGSDPMKEQRFVDVLFTFRHRHALANYF